MLVLSGSCDVVSVSFTPTYFLASGDNRCIIVSGRFVADRIFFTIIYYGATRWRRDGERASLDWRRGGNCRRHGRLGASR